MYRTRKRSRPRNPDTRVSCATPGKLRKAGLLERGPPDFADISQVLYDALIQLLCDTINSHDGCSRVSHSEQSTEERELGDARWVIAWALMRMPLVNRDCAALRARDPVYHSALIGYERTRAFHYPDRVPHWASSAGHNYDTRWFLGAWPRCITLIHGNVSLPPSHPIGKSTAHNPAKMGPWKRWCATHVT